MVHNIVFSAFSWQANMPFATEKKQKVIQKIFEIQYHQVAKPEVFFANNQPYAIYHKLQLMISLLISKNLNMWVKLFNKYKEYIHVHFIIGSYFSHKIVKWLQYASNAFLENYNNEQEPGVSGHRLQAHLIGEGQLTMFFQLWLNTNQERKSIVDYNFQGNKAKSRIIKYNKSSIITWNKSDDSLWQEATHFR